VAKQKTSRKTTKKAGGTKKAAKAVRQPTAKKTTTGRAKAKATGAAGRSPARSTAKKTPGKKSPRAASAAPAAEKPTKKRDAATPPRARKRTPAPVTRPVVAGAAADAGLETPKAPKREKLSAKELEQFRQMLLEKRAELMGDVSTLHNEALNRNRQDAAGDLSTMPIHMADLGTDNYELEFTLGLIEGERTILREIEEALARIDAGTYGYCLATGEPIGKARLKATPWAKYSYEYTLAQERGQTRRI